ncbi:MAG: molecular chaperone TorD family protein [Actinobacteria bacterium]|nr:molecular chaperone TorD family protein [Actinomycetota bacterium]
MDLLDALAVFAEEPAPTHERLRELLGLSCTPDAATFAELFAFSLYPYASVYLGAEGKLGGVARDRVAGFFRALGATPPAEPDHLTVLLSAYARLRRDAPAAHAADALLHEHVLSWLPLYLSRVRALAPAPYPQWADLLARTLMADARQAGDLSRRCLHLRTAPTLADPRVDGQDAFIAGMLAPVCAGMVLTGADLRRAARDLQVGVRVGERRFVLTSLFAQCPAALLRWLAAHTHTTIDAWRPWAAVAPDTTRWWTTRATTTRAHLLDLADHVAHADPATTGAGP